MTSDRRKVPGITVYPRGARWAYLVEGPPHPLTGDRVRRYRGGFTSFEEAWQGALQAKRRVDHGSVAHAKRIRVDAFLEEWLEATKPSLKASTYSGYRNIVLYYVNPTLGHRWLSELSVQTLNLFYRHLMDQGRCRSDTNSQMYEFWSSRQTERGGLGPLPSEIAAATGTTKEAARAAAMRFRRGRIPLDTPKGLSTKSVKNVHGLLRRALGDAVAWEYLLSNPAVHAVLPRVRASRAVQRQAPWTIEQLGRWLLVALDDRYHGLWALVATTGMRRSELAGVRRSLLDLDQGVLVLEDTRVVVDGRAEDSDGKTAAGRRLISLDDFTIAHLAEYLAKIDAEAEAFELPPHEFLAVGLEGRRLHPDTLTRRFNRLVDRAGVPRIRLHDVRHTYATLAMNAGVDPKVLSDRIGHANTGITLQVYAHRSTGLDRPMAEQMSRLIAAATEAARAE
ncbi:MAG TPA: tyrosine-type recombinase/integrase [Microlunatus sp.]